MRRLLLALPFALVFAAAAPALAQAPAAPVVEAVTAAQVQGLIDAAKADRKNGEAITTKIGLSLAPYTTVVEYRPGTAPAALHASNAEVITVLDGAATLVTGGALIGQKDAGAGNWSGTGITAGASRPIAKGDWIIVPQGTPHQFVVAAGGSGVVLMTIKIPRS
jgi:mannose-6-phosphate isomerase-like protein (cupin superfamily)